MEVARHAVGGRVHVHRGDDHPVGQLQPADPERLEHRRARLAGVLLAGREPLVHRGHELGVAQPQVVVGDPAAAGHDVERELVRVLPGVLAEVLEPLQAGLRGALGRSDHRPALGLVGGEAAVDAVLFMQARSQGQRVLHGQLGTRADGEVRGVRGVADQNHVLVPPGLAPDRAERGPPGVVGHQTVLATTGPAEHVGTQLPDALDRGLVALTRRQPRGLGEPGPLPDVLVHLQDEGAGPVAVRIPVDLHDPGRGVQDVELERVEDQVRAEPDVLAPAPFQIWAERSGVRRPGQRVRSVGGHHQVVARGQGRHVWRLGAEQDPYPELCAPGLQHGQQPFAAHRGEAVPAGGERRAPEVHIDVVPAGELAAHELEDLEVGMLDAAQRLVGEDHAEAERVVGGVALPDSDVMPGVELLGQRGEVQPARAAAQDRDPHGAPPPGLPRGRFACFGRRLLPCLPPPLPKPRCYAGSSTIVNRTQYAVPR